MSRNIALWQPTISKLITITATTETPPIVCTQSIRHKGTFTYFSVFDESDVKRMKFVLA